MKTQTIDEVKANPEFMNGLEILEYSFSVFLIYQGSDKLKYFAFWKGALLFQGEVKMNKNALTTACELLKTLTVRPGNTENCTISQMQWYSCDHCKELHQKAKAFFDHYDKGHKEAELFFKMRFVL